jgi:small subunit ribosomal protein S1
VELDPIVYGLCHVNELDASGLRDPSELLKEGETREFKIISIEPKDHRLGLSIKALSTQKTSSSEKETPSETLPVT